MVPECHKLSLELKISKSDSKSKVKIYRGYDLRCIPIHETVYNLEPSCNPDSSVRVCVGKLVRVLSVHAVGMHTYMHELELF